MAAQVSAQLDLSIPCRIHEVRPAVAILRQYLQIRGFSEEELSACELAIVEALNNAIQYALDSGETPPVRLEAVCTVESVLFRVTDHTRGFALPDQIELPPFDAERGRGLFLIKSAMDQISYELGPDGNCLTMKRKRKIA